MLLVVWSVAALASALPCGMPQVGPHLRYTPVIEALRAAPGPKLDRDAFDLPNAATSANFAVRWGDTGQVRESDVAHLLAAFETAWEVFVEDLGHPAPPGAQTYRFNVYLGDTGDGAPDSLDAGGYFFLDPEDHPMVVVNRTSLANPLQAEGLAVHEFFHALQYATDRYPYLGPSAWWWEATAEWAAAEVAPESPFSGTFLFAYAGLTPLPLAHFDYPDTGAPEELYQYGAFVFATHATEVAGPTLVRDTWLDDTTEPDVLEVLREHLGRQGLPLEGVFLDHVARNATWDYRGGETWAQSVEQLTRAYGLDPVTRIFSQAGSGGTHAIEDAAPGHLGYNAIRLRRPDRGALRVSIDGAPQGTFGSPAGFGARLVQVWPDGQLAYHDVPFDGSTGGLTLDVGTEENVWLMVAAWRATTRRSSEGERFPYTFALHVEAPEVPPESTPPPSGAPDPACGCRGAPILRGAPWALAALLLFSRRTSRSSRRASCRPA